MCWCGCRCNNNIVVNIVVVVNNYSRAKEPLCMSQKGKSVSKREVYSHVCGSEHQLSFIISIYGAFGNIW